MKVTDGVTDAQGQVVIEDHHSGTASYKVKLSNGNEYELPVKAELKTPDDKLAACGFRAAQADTRDRAQHYLHRRDEESNP